MAGSLDFISLDVYAPTPVPSRSASPNPGQSPRGGSEHQCPDTRKKGPNKKALGTDDRVIEYPSIRISQIKYFDRFFLRSPEYPMYVRYKNSVPGSDC